MTYLVSYWPKSSHKYLFDAVYCNTSLRAWFSFDPGFQLVTSDKNALKSSNYFLKISVWNWEPLFSVNKGVPRIQIKNPDKCIKYLIILGSYKRKQSFYVTSKNLQKILSFPIKCLGLKPLLMLSCHLTLNQLFNRPHWTNFKSVNLWLNLCSYLAYVMILIKMEDQ